MTKSPIKRLKNNKPKDFTRNRHEITPAMKHSIVLQPIDQGIISNFKCNYRKTLVQHMLAEIEEKDKYEAIMFIVEAWKRMIEQTIKNCVCYEEKRTIEEIKVLLNKYKAK